MMHHLELRLTSAVQLVTSEQDVVTISTEKPHTHTHTHSHTMSRQPGGILIFLSILNICGATNIMQFLSVLDRSLGNEVVTECDLVVLGEVDNIQEMVTGGKRGVFQFASLDTVTDFEDAKFPNSPCLVLVASPPMGPTGNRSNIIDFGRNLHRYKALAALVFESKKYGIGNDYIKSQEILFPILVLRDTGK